jgi:hypothetical protein
VAQSARLNINLRLRAISTLNLPTALRTARTLEWKGIGTWNTSSALLEGRRPTRLVARRGLPRSFAPGGPITAGFRDSGLLPRLPRLAASWLLLRWPCCPCWSCILAALVGLAGLASLAGLHSRCPCCPCCPALPFSASPPCGSWPGPPTRSYSPPSRTPSIVPSPLRSTSPIRLLLSSSPPHSSSISSVSNIAITKTHLTPHPSACSLPHSRRHCSNGGFCPLSHPAARLAPHRLDSTACACALSSRKNCDSSPSHVPPSHSTQLSCPPLRRTLESP